MGRKDRPCAYGHLYGRTERATGGQDGVKPAGVSNRTMKAQRILMRDPGNLSDCGPAAAEDRVRHPTAILVTVCSWSSVSLRFRKVDKLDLSGMEALLPVRGVSNHSLHKQRRVGPALAFHTAARPKKHKHHRKSNALRRRSKIITVAERATQRSHGKKQRQFHCSSPGVCFTKSTSRLPEGRRRRLSPASPNPGVAAKKFS